MGEWNGLQNLDKFSIFSLTGVMKCQSKTHFAFIQKGKRNRRDKQF